MKESPSKPYDEEQKAGLDELQAKPPDPWPDASDVETQVSDTAHRERLPDAEALETTGLDELEAAAPDRDSDDERVHNHRSLEEVRSEEQDGHSRRTAVRGQPQILAQLFDHSHLIFFSILGVLARLGLTSLTSYPGAPVATTVLWANVSGSFIIGFLREDRMLFRRHWHASVEKSRIADQTGPDDAPPNTDSAQEAFITARSTIHSFIGMTVGFCGTFTSFADMIRDAFLAISDDLETAEVSNHVYIDALRPRNDAYSALAVIAVLWTQVSMSLAALQLGAHLAIGMRRFANAIPVASWSLETPLNISIVVLGWGSWIGAIIMAISPPHRSWRGQAIFAVIFAPLGAVLRFHLAKLLNPRYKSFPLGTFAANVLGTCVLGLVFDLQRTRIGSRELSCQVLQGVGDGYAGGLTTVSTWVLELKALRLKHAYFYGFTSLAATLACMVAIIGPLKWTEGFESVSCRI